ncbi:TorD/DmsD family molecular chaperone [Roseibium aquae]|nr:molecular chaperone TorD family protein [Roseibium aquae]
MTQGVSRGAVAPEDADRADLYDFIGALLQAAPNSDLLRAVAAMEIEPALSSTDVGKALERVIGEARKTDEATLKRAYHDLFIGIGRGELVPYGSYYLTGFLNEKPLADLRASMAQLGIARNEGVCEPEDHIASLMQMMGGLIRGDLWHEGPLPLAAQQAFFSGHIGKWAPHFFKDLEAQTTSPFYAAAGGLGRVLMAVEADAFSMAA